MTKSKQPNVSSDNLSPAPWDDTDHIGLERELEDHEGSHWQDSELSLDDIGLTQESGQDLVEEYLDEIDEDDLKD